MPLSEFIVSTFFTFCITVFAVWVITTQTALLTGISLLNLSIIFSIIILPILLLLAKKYFELFKRSITITRDSEIHTIIILLLLALIGVIISLVVIVPNPDDVDYTSRAIYFLKHYNEPLDLNRHDHALVQFPMTGVLNIFKTMEFFCAYLAFILHLPFLHIYHFLLPALGGAMIPLAWFLAFAKFSKRTVVAALAATAVCVFLSLDGAPHRSFGNYAFVRIWQNKAILMSVGVPLFTAFSLDFFRAPTFLHWSRLFLLLVACAGLSPMAPVFMPFMGFLLAFSWSWCAYETGNHQSVKRLLIYFTSYAYLLLVTLNCAIALNRTSLDHIGSLRRFFPTTFEGQFKLVFVDFLSYPSIMFVLFFILSVVIVEKSHRRFLTVWIISCVTLLLNPIVFPFVSKITTFNTYWRLFYLLPFPLMIGLPLIFLDRVDTLKPGLYYLAFFGLLLVSTLGNLVPHNYATFGKAPFAFGQYKIYPPYESDVKKIIAVSKPGPMLAPYLYSQMIPRYSPDFPQICVRDYTLMAFSMHFGKKEEANNKFRAMHYVAGKTRKGLREVQSLIRRGLVNVVLDTSVTRRKEWHRFSTFLARSGFECVEKNGRFLVYVRNEKD